MTGRLRVDVHLAADDIRAALRRDVLHGLTATPKVLPPKWFYDDHGCELFDKITRLPEYYPTERERQILLDAAPEIAALTDADTLVELGAGTSDKTRTLLDALRAHGTLRRFVPFEISEATVRQAAGALLHEYPNLEVHAVVGDFDHHLEWLPDDGRRLVAFLGGTIGNFEPDARAAFLREVADALHPGDHLILGTDLVKDVDRLEAAYDDAAGVTAQFNLNVLAVINRELDADFDLDLFEHRAFFDTDREWIEMRLRALEAHLVHIDRLDLEVAFGAGEEVRTEISAKFRREGVERELAAAGLGVVRWLTDRDGDFGVSISAPA